jgi:hypothetical protein
MLPRFLIALSFALKGVCAVAGATVSSLVLETRSTTYTTTRCQVALTEQGNGGVPGQPSSVSYSSSRNPRDDLCWRGERYWSAYAETSACSENTGFVTNELDLMQSRRGDQECIRRFLSSVWTVDEECTECLHTNCSNSEDLFEQCKSFCGLELPDASIFAEEMRDFLKEATAPNDSNLVDSFINKMIDLKSIIPIFPRAPNSKPLAAASSTTASSTSTAILSPSPPFPTALLSQLPLFWPYKDSGVTARRPGQYATFSLSDASNGEVSALVIASLQWLPRPLGKLSWSFVPSRSPSQTTIAASSAAAQTPIRPPSSSTLGNTEKRPTTLATPPTMPIVSAPRLPSPSLISLLPRAPESS